MSIIISKGSFLPGLPGVFANFDSNVTGAEGDLVNVQGGQLEIADAAERIAGQLQEAVTNASEGAQVEITPFMVVIMDNDNDGATFGATAVGESFDITGGTNAQVVDTSTGTGLEATTASGQLVCLEYNPQGVGFDSDLSIGKFMIRESQFSQV